MFHAGKFVGGVPGVGGLALGKNVAGCRAENRAEYSPDCGSLLTGHGWNGGLGNPDGLRSCLDWMRGAMFVASLVRGH